MNVMGKKDPWSGDKKWNLNTSNPEATLAQIPKKKYLHLKSFRKKIGNTDIITNSLIVQQILTANII
jgi:hypothetical protein